MKASTHFGDHFLLEEMEKNLTGTLMRCATLADGKLEKHHLLEIIDPALSGDAGFLKSFLDHVKITSKLEHPNFLNKTGVLQEEGQLAATYDFHEGFTLEKILASCQTQYIPMSLDHGLLITSKLLSVLVYGKTKNLSHGLIHPSLIFITNEGEVKLRGFSLAPSIALMKPAPLVLNPSNNRFLPQGVDLGQTGAEQLDIYACGNLFYEILMGKPYSSPPAEAGSVISQARMENDGEPIPTKIANMLVAALGLGQPTAYQSIRKMADDMEQLLLSGQYNPTTFNLAFFMNSSLREDMDALESKLEQEKAATYQQSAKAAALPPKAAIAPAAVVTPPVRTAQPETVPQEKKKSKAILWVALLLLFILGFGFTYFFYLKKDDGESQFAKQQELIKAEGEQLELEQARKAQEAKDREIEQLKLLVQQQTEAERARKKREIEEEMAAMDEEIERLKSQEDQQRKQKEMNDQLEKLKAEKAALEERERQAQEERDRLAQLEKERELEKQKEQERIAAEQAAKEKEAEQSQIAQANGGAGPENTTTDEDNNASAMPVAPPEPISTTADNLPVYYVGQPGVSAPVFTRKSAPKYPVKAKRMKVQGSVTLEAVFRSDGKVGQMDVIKGVGKGRYGLEDAAMQAVKQWKFRPGQFQGNPANVRLKVSVDFVLQ